MQKVLESRYTFYALKGYDATNSEQYITTHFLQLSGKRMHRCYAIGLGDTSGSLALAEGFMSVRYLVLHKLRSPIVFSLKAGPRLISREQLGQTPHKMKDSDIYLLFR